jgi:hypothetical protein
MTSKTSRSASLPSVVFALAFVLFGWIGGHAISYALVDLLPHGHHHHHEPQIHGYMGALKLAGGVGLVLGFVLALRVFFRRGSFGEWLHEGGVSGTRKQISLATALPASVYVLVEYLERLAAGTGTSPSARLLLVGVFVQLVVGLSCLALVRFTFRVAARVIRSIARSTFSRLERRANGPILKHVAIVCPPCPMAGAAAGRAPPFSDVTSRIY